MKSTKSSPASGGDEPRDSPAWVSTRATFLQRLFRWLTTLATVALHVGAALTLLFAKPRGSDVLFAVGFYLAAMFVVTAGYHRYFAHRAYRTSRAFQALLALAGCLCTQKGVLWWASTHRHHHRRSDTPEDPHSPHHRGFWHSHLLWTLSSEYEGYDASNVRDLSRFPELRWLDRFSTVPLVLYIAACAGIGGLHGLGWWYAVPTVAVMHAVMLVNSVSHLCGRRRFATDDQSRNNAALALLTLGEGWHNNHHRYMSSARQGFYPWEIDLTFYGLRALQAMGVVWDLRRVPQEVLEEGLLEMSDTPHPYDGGASDRASEPLQR